MGFPLHREARSFSGMADTAGLWEPGNSKHLECEIIVVCLVVGVPLLVFVISAFVVSI